MFALLHEAKTANMHMLCLEGAKHPAVWTDLNV